MMLKQDPVGIWNENNFVLISAICPFALWGHTKLRGSSYSFYLHLLYHRYPAEKISILTTYNGQRSLINDVLQRRCSWNPFFGRPATVATVDQYQGQQNDCKYCAHYKDTKENGSTKPSVTYRHPVILSTHENGGSPSWCAPSDCGHVSGSSRALRVWPSSTLWKLLWTQACLWPTFGTPCQIMLTTQWIVSHQATGKLKIPQTPKRKSTNEASCFCSWMTTRMQLKWIMSKKWAI